jgi:hypothetical protein
MTVKTLIPQMKDTYTSFPTFMEHENRICVFYRQGSGHVLGGKVKCFEMDKGIFLKAFHNREWENLYNLGKDYVVFEDENENEALVSRLDENLYSLATRTYDGEDSIKTYMSFSENLTFKERAEVRIVGVEWLVFYGKAFKWDQGYVFPAYGRVIDERPLLLITDDFTSWEVLSILPSNFGGSILNESSIAFDGEQYTIFMRDDIEPFGIWYSKSDDLQKWSSPERLVPSAHAPMSIYKDGKILMTYRELISEDTTAVSLIAPFSDMEKVTIETFKGNPYDGGYTDIRTVNDEIYVVYYTGNEDGEPYINVCKVFDG